MYCTCIVWISVIILIHLYSYIVYAFVVLKQLATSVDQVLSIEHHWRFEEGFWTAPCVSCITMWDWHIFIGLISFIKSSQYSASAVLYIVALRSFFSKRNFNIQIISWFDPGFRKFWNAKKFWRKSPPLFTGKICLFLTHFLQVRWPRLWLFLNIIYRTIIIEMMILKTGYEILHVLTLLLIIMRISTIYYTKLQI